MNNMYQPHRNPRRPGAQPNKGNLRPRKTRAGVPNNGRDKDPKALHRHKQLVPRMVRESDANKLLKARAATGDNRTRSRRAGVKPLSPLQVQVKQAHKFDKILSFIFLVPLIVLGVLFLFWPRQLTSQSENRALAQAPKFSWKEFFSGEFNAGIDKFYADQFPLREGFLNLNRGYEGLLDISKWGNQKDEIHLISARKDGGGQGGVEHIPGEESAPKTTDEVAESEKTSTEPVKKIEDNTPKADREIKETALDISNNASTDWESSNIVIIQGRAMEIHYYSEEFTKSYAKRVNHLRSILPDSVRVSSLIAPTSVAFYGTDELRSGGYSTLSAIRNIYENEDPEIFKVDAYTEIAKHIDDYIYFRTDHHWNGKGAYYAYRAFCDTLGLEASELSDMTLTNPEEPFLGSLYGYTGQSPLLLESKDVADIYLPKYNGFYNYYLTDDMAMEEPISGTLLAANVFNENHYMLFLGGDVALGHIKSENHNGKSICVIKDSYGNAFIPYLIDNFEDIYIVDPRQFVADLPAFISEHEIQDVLMLNYTFAISNPNWLDGFDSITSYVE